MVVKMMKWRPWQSKKLEARITVHHLKSSFFAGDDGSRYSVQVKWKGAKGISLTSLRRKSVRRNFTKEMLLNQHGIASWQQEFRCFCAFSPYKDGLFHPWEVSFTLFNGSNSVASASLNLADFDKQRRDIDIPLVINASLHLSILLVELRNVQDQPEPAPKPILMFPRSPCYGEMFSPEKQDLSTLKASPIRVNIFKGLSALRPKRAGQDDSSSDGRSSDRSEGGLYPLDSDSDDHGSGEGLSEEDSGDRKSFSYGTLAYANYAGAASAHSNTSSGEDEDWLYYTHHTKPTSPPDHPMQEQNSKRRLLPWRKRKLSFKSPKMKGEPLLKKCYGEEGGDDIDFDRRQLSSSDESTLMKDGESSAMSGSAFGDDGFAIGTWEDRDITSRDGHMKLKTKVFFASIDQRHERAAGESACTALVAVIADWLQSNDNEMPIKSQLDSLIREGSLEWRNLCDNETYRERFPDKHFDLETVLEAKVRPLSVVPEKSFVGFFHPEGMDDKGCDVLQGAMSFDNIWDEISASASEMPPSARPLIYIISWNDHFFLLKVEQDAYYIIDTLGERLYEGCNQAYILKFDSDSAIHQRKNDDKPEENDDKEGSPGKEVDTNNLAEGKNVEESSVVCTGKESCKEYIKSFLAAIPIRELLVDLKKGLLASTPLHHRLQIEFHYTKCLHPQNELLEAEVVDDTKGTLPLEEVLEAKNF
ncbi:hypothetical protein SASPL_102461 [Salvia splendens]|uniref:C2 NT-type domain-containing protein n=1 Tax=Salvia splendens TaxID=180675 RepID=A0A8X8YW02_SALSN|nr:uncharacterized protein LOC121749470 [Salvia splendens]KAG6437542.1 hypothetical protein SASPL_102461 [Salvia splendens]